MAIIGTVFSNHTQEFGALETAIVGSYLICRVMVNNNAVIKFPLANTVDKAEVALRTANIINQTGLVDKPCRVETEAVE